MTVQTHTGILKPLPSRNPIVPSVHRAKPRKQRKKATVLDLAKFIGCSRRTMCRWIDNYPGKLNLYDIQSVLSFAVSLVKERELHNSPTPKRTRRQTHV